MLDNNYIIKLTKLYDGLKNQWYYVLRSEVLLAEWLFKNTTMSPVIDISEGYRPDWDMVCEDGTTIEVKFSGGHRPFIELKKDGGIKSGLSLTTADKYLMITHNYTVGKIRLCETSDIKEFYEKNKHRINIHCFNEGTSQSSYGFFLDVYNNIPTHEWIGDIPAVIMGSNAVSYDLTPSHVIKVSRNFEKPKESA